METEFVLLIAGQLKSVSGRVILREFSGLSCENQDVWSLCL
jgi:hypothetical protein